LGSAILSGFYGHSLAADFACPVEKKIEAVLGFVAKP
jgi:hypothetical protein